MQFISDHHKRLVVLMAGLTLCASVLSPPQVPPANRLSPEKRSVANHPKKVDDAGAANSRGRSEPFPKLPLSFEANRGQADPSVKFLSRAQGYSLFVTSTDVIMGVADSSSTSSPGRDSVAGAKHSTDPSDTPRPDSLRMKLTGADSAATVIGLDELPGRANYLIGNDPKNWHTGISTYARVKCENVYPGTHGRLARSSSRARTCPYRCETRMRKQASRSISRPQKH